MDSIVLETSLGDIQLELYWNHAPKVRLNTNPEAIPWTEYWMHIRLARILQNSQGGAITMAWFSIALSPSVYDVVALMI
jgi:hypothetical protein